MPCGSTTSVCNSLVFVGHDATHRFVLEPLEPRELLSGNTFTVNANTDSGTGTGTKGDLRYCITQVNNDPVTNQDTINFAIGGPATIAPGLGLAGHHHAGHD